MLIMIFKKSSLGLPRITWLILLGVLVSFQYTVVAKTWILIDEQQLEGDIVSAKNGMVVIRTANSRQLISLDKFSDEDRDYIVRKYPKARKQEVKRSQPPVAQAKPNKQENNSTELPMRKQPLPQRNYRMVAPEIKLDGVAVRTPPPKLEAKLPKSPDLHSIDSLRGKVVLVVIRRAYDEKFLNQHLPTLKKMYRHYHNLGLELMELVSYTKYMKEVNGRQQQMVFMSGRYRDSNQLDWYLRLDQKGLIAKKWGVNHPHPVFVLVDKNGLIAGAYSTTQGLSYHIDKQLGIGR